MVPALAPWLFGVLGVLMIQWANQQNPVPRGGGRRERRIRSRPLQAWREEELLGEVIIQSKRPL